MARSRIIAKSTPSSRLSPLANISLNRRRAAAIPEGHLAVTECFESFQGEGVRMGLPSFFVRLQYCDGTCVWCDTKYTWLKGGTGKIVRISDLLDRVRDSKMTNVVVTGGEPFLQREALSEFLPAALSISKTVEIETNGAHPPLGIPGIQYNVSPKLPGAKSNLVYDKEILAAYRIEDAWFKFVIESPGDIDQAVEFVYLYGLSPTRVLFMPEGTKPQTVRDRLAWMAPLVREKFPSGRLTPRLHIEVFGGARRGV